MKENTVYNQADNKLYVKTDGDKIVIICNKESQQEKVHKIDYRNNNRNKKKGPEGKPKSQQSKETREKEQGKGGRPKKEKTVT